MTVSLLSIANYRDLHAQTFIDRFLPSDLRVVSYNVYNTSIFSTSSTQPEKYARMMQALDPDIINLQEIYSRTGVEVAQLMDTILPLANGAKWHGHDGDDNAIVSRYSLSMLATNTVPEKDGTGIALVDLPNSHYATDLYVMNNHFTCCSVMNPPQPTDARLASRQAEADALAQ